MKWSELRGGRGLEPLCTSRCWSPYKYKTKQKSHRSGFGESALEGAQFLIRQLEYFGL